MVESAVNSIKRKVILICHNSLEKSTIDSVASRTLPSRISTINAQSSPEINIL